MVTITEFNALPLKEQFCLMFDVEFHNEQVTPEGYVYLDLRGRNDGEYVLTLSTEQLPEFMDRATGHYAPFPQNSEYGEFVDEYYNHNYLD